MMSLDITQCHARTVPKLSQTRDRHGLLMTPELTVVNGRFATAQMVLCFAIASRATLSYFSFGTRLTAESRA